MKKYVCIRKGYLIDVDSVVVDKEMALTIDNDDGGFKIYYPATIKYGKSLLKSVDIDNETKVNDRYDIWLDVNPDGNGFVEYGRRRDSNEIIRRYVTTEQKTLVTSDGTSPFIIEFASDTDAELYLNLTYEGDEYYNEDSLQF